MVVGKQCGIRPLCTWDALVVGPSCEGVLVCRFLCHIHAGVLFALSCEHAVHLDGVWCEEEATLTPMQVLQNMGFCELSRQPVLQEGALLSCIWLLEY